MPPYHENNDVEKEKTHSKGDKTKHNADISKHNADKSTHNADAKPQERKSGTKQGIDAKQIRPAACTSDPKTNRKRENKSKMHLIQK